MKLVISGRQGVKIFATLYLGFETVCTIRGTGITDEGSFYMIDTGGTHSSIEKSILAEVRDSRLDVPYDKRLVLGLRQLSNI